MVDLRDQLTIVFGFEMAAAAIAAIVYGLTLFSYWCSMDKFDERKRKIVGACILAAALVFSWALFALVEVRRFDAAVTAAVILSVAFVRWIFFAVAGGSIAFGLSKFYELKDTPTWVFVICTLNAFGNLGAATFTSLDNAAQRWMFFGMSLAWLAAALIVQTLTDNITGWSTPSASDEDTFARGFVRLWVCVTWSAIWLIWFLGPFGLDVSGVFGEIIWEQAWYLVLGFLGFLATGLVVLFTFSPYSAGIRASQSYRQMARDATTFQRAVAPVTATNGKARHHQ